jgi:glyceraldehyde 3-phosphate dehydrogenase
MVRVAINGFGRIGRMILRVGLQDPELDFIAVNDMHDAPTLAHLLKYDSVHGKFQGSIEARDELLVVNGKEIKVCNEKEPENLPWNDLDVDVVAECTGIFRTHEAASKHITAGAKKVLLSAPAKGDTPVKTIVKGVNEHELTSEDVVVSNASCTTNCFAPVAKVLNDNFTIKRGYMVTVHAYTANQHIVDGAHKDPRRGRAGAVNLVPTTSGAAKAVGLVIPELQGKLHASAIRAPVPCGSICYFTCELGKEPSREDVNTLFKNVAGHHLHGVLEYSEEPLVSTDILGNNHSAIFDAERTHVDASLLKVVAWYDNEWGYSCRMLDVMKCMFNTL